MVQAQDLTRRKLGLEKWQHSQPLSGQNYNQTLGVTVQGSRSYSTNCQRRPGSGTYGKVLWCPHPVEVRLGKSSNLKSCLTIQLQLQGVDAVRSSELQRSSISQDQHWCRFRLLQQSLQTAVVRLTPLLLSFSPWDKIPLRRCLLV